jgi:hypothetical protein
MFFTVDETQGLKWPSVESADPANVTDTDTFKELTRSIDPPSAMVINHPAGNSSAGVSEGPGPQANQTEAGSFNTGSTVIVDHFPLDAAGAPISGIPQGHSIFESC